MTQKRKLQLYRTSCNLDHMISHLMQKSKRPKRRIVDGCPTTYNPMKAYQYWFDLRDASHTGIAYAQLWRSRAESVPRCQDECVLHPKILQYNWRDIFHKTGKTSSLCRFGIRKTSPRPVAHRLPLFFGEEIKNHVCAVWISFGIDIRNSRTSGFRFGYIRDRGVTPRARKGKG